MTVKNIVDKDNIGLLKKGHNLVCYAIVNVQTLQIILRNFYLTEFHKRFKTCVINSTVNPLMLV